MKKRFSLTTVAIIFGVALFLGFQINSLISGDNIFEQLSKFKDVLSITEKNYVDNVDTPKLVENAINGLLSNLDPHSVYIPPKELVKVTEDFQGSYDGIGVEYQVLQDTLIVVSPLPGGPSEALGIMSGDKIVKINDSSCVGIKQDDVPKKLRGPKGTHVKVAIVRAGINDLVDFDITRDKIPINSVDVSYMLDNEVGYVAVNRFSATTNDEFVAALTKLKSEGMKRLILDLRNNPGGYLDQAFRMADEFLPGGKMIVYTKGRKVEFNEEHRSSGEGRFTKVPLIVLVNAGSASASEIVSGAVQDWDRGLIVGETTFGKGLVQRQFQLPDNSAFRLTIARYYTPTGRAIQRPYGKDLDAYRRQAFERDEEEGANLQHNEEKDSTRPVYKTPLGRKVYGGGGITPDYIVKAERADTLYILLLSHGVFREYSLDVIESQGKEIRSTYGKDILRFRHDFNVSEAMVSDFINVAKKKGVTVDSARFRKEQKDIFMRIKAEVARIIWGNEGMWVVFSESDVQLQKALTLFPEAEKIAGLR